MCVFSPNCKLHNAKRNKGKKGKRAYFAGNNINRGCYNQVFVHVEKILAGNENEITRGT